MPIHVIESDLCVLSVENLQEQVSEWDFRIYARTVRPNFIPVSIVHSMLLADIGIVQKQ